MKRGGEAEGRSGQRRERKREGRYQPAREGTLWEWGGLGGGMASSPESKSPGPYLPRRASYAVAGGASSGNRLEHTHPMAGLASHRTRALLEPGGYYLLLSLLLLFLGVGQAARRSSSQQRSWWCPVVEGLNEL